MAIVAKSQYGLLFGVNESMPAKIADYTIRQSPDDWVKATCGSETFFVGEDESNWMLFLEGRIKKGYPGAGKVCVRTDLPSIVIKKNESE